MSDLLRSYLTIGVFSVVAVALVAAVMGLGSLVRPSRPQPEKYVNYESGVARAYVTVQRLRSLGLKDVLITRDDGYLLDPDVKVERRSED